MEAALIEWIQGRGAHFDYRKWAANPCLTIYQEKLSSQEGEKKHVAHKQTHFRWRLILRVINPCKCEENYNIVGDSVMYVSLLV